MRAANDATGDADLATWLTEHRPRGSASISAGRIAGGQTRVAAVGLPEGQRGARFELGSVTKTFNGLLLADAVERGEVAASDTVERHLTELAGTPAGSVTLAELASHRSGLPRLAPGNLLVDVLDAIAMRNPYSATTAAVIDSAAGAPLTNRGTFAYSNLGAALLGHALARATSSADWPTLVRTRLFSPLGMTETTFASQPDQVPALGLPGHTLSGHTPDVWAGEGNLPAGCCTWTTVDDLARYATALLEGTAPGMTALDPLWDTGTGDRTGLGWFVTDEGSRTLTWHNGGTAGASSILLLDRQAGHATIVLGNSAAAVDTLGWALATDTTPEPEGLPWLRLGVTALLLGVVAGTVWHAFRPRRRTRVVSDAADLCAIGLLVWRLGAWDVVPGWVASTLLGLGLGAILVGARQWRSLPVTDHHPVSNWVEVGASAALLAAALALLT